MQRPTISNDKNKEILAVGKCSRLCVNFRAGTFQLHKGNLAKLEFPSQTTNKSSFSNILPCVCVCVGGGGGVVMLPSSKLCLITLKHKKFSDNNFVGKVVAILVKHTS